VDRAVAQLQALGDSHDAQVADRLGAGAEDPRCDADDDAVGEALAGTR
jgi:hypothetical protein